MEEIKKIFNERKAENINFRRINAVNILLKKREDEIYIVLEKRSLKLNSQPGDISFPGGRVEIGETPRDAALRETIEELNVKEKEISYLSEMGSYIIQDSSIIYIFISELLGEINNPSLDEVDHVFEVPLNFFIETTAEKYEMIYEPNFPENFPFDLIQNGKDYKFRKVKVKEYFYKFEDYTIWGFTARIIREFIKIIQNYEKE
ncbi:NUDIX hydrolase [Clostridium sp. DL1XJH146]